MSKIPAVNSVVIESVSPEIDGGAAPVKRVVGEQLTVSADIFSHGHEVVQARLLYRERGQQQWHESEMEHRGNDRWDGSFLLESNCEYEYTLIAWRDPFLSWLADMSKRHKAGMDLRDELAVGATLLERALPHAASGDRQRLDAFLARMVEPGTARDSLERAAELAEATLGYARDGADVAQQLAELHKVLVHTLQLSLSVEGQDPADITFSSELSAIMARYPDRSDIGRYGKVLRVIADRKPAEFASWYEMWPRSQGTDPTRSATFAEMQQRLPEIRQMGFSVVYLPPIHPIGEIARKGPNNSLLCPPGSPGCPYAIGSKDGGHTAIDPGLGTLEDFRGFERACRHHGMEIALDLALQCSPDHPWVEQHPQWFLHRPDGTIRFAENPPKKYQDIYPLNFQTEDREGLYNACLEIVRFWIDEGVRIFRVDNPHTKPLQFWGWLIDQVRSDHPDVIFLAEAFTRPKVMRALAKAGFQQSYTYFTWRNFKHELTEYFTELTSPPVVDVMRGNLFTNTPDILPRMLQNAPRAAFMMRAALAGTLSSVWGLYNGFELCEGRALPGTEEYADSEKYQFKVWDWDRPGNIKGFIAHLNRIRAEQPALQQYRNLRFHQTTDDNLLAYSKWSTGERNTIVVVVNLDPYKAHEGFIDFPIETLGIAADESYQMHDLLADKRYFWRGRRNFVKLDPAGEVAHVFRLMRWQYREQDFDYYN